MVTKQQTKIAAQQWSKVDNWKELHCGGGRGLGGVLIEKFREEFAFKNFVF